MIATRDVIVDALAAMAAQGIVCAEPGRIVPDGKVHRFRIEGERAGKRSGWIIVHTDAPSFVVFGDWREGVTHRVRLDGQPATYADRARFDGMIAAAKAQREAEQRDAHAGAAAKAGTQLAVAAAADPAHPYLARKGVKAHGIKQQGVALLVPVRDVEGALHSLETIFPDGTKRFLAGGRKRGCFHMVGEPDGRIAIAEGYATGASIYEASGVATAVAFDAGNLRPVALALRARHARADFIVMADNDEAGIRFGREAAAAVRGRMAIAKETSRGN